MVQKLHEQDKGSLYFCSTIIKSKMETINDIQDAVIKEFEIFDEWLDRYEYLIELSKDIVPFDPKNKTNEYLINGCQSRVWLTAEMRDDAVIYAAETDAIITKGIIALLIRVLSGQKPKDIVDADLYFIDKIGLRQNLSPTRSNGLLSMVKQMKLYALAFDSLNVK
jgi:cysteine desulfuration protein SufE